MYYTAEVSVLTSAQIQSILDSMTQGVQVGAENALYATTHNPRVSKWTPGKGHHIAKNK